MILSVRGAEQPDWQGLIGGLHEVDLDSPRRSTIPLIAYWQDPATRVASLLAKLGFPATLPLTFSFEHAVYVIGGRGKASYTDLMILAPSVAIAVEGKYTEPPYEEVGAWLREPPEKNRCAVLGGWFDMLRAATGVQLTVDSVLHLPYQLIHRAASACWPPAMHRAVVYQIFESGLRDHYVATLRGLRAIVPAAALQLAVLETPVTASNAYTGLLARWDQGERKMAQAVRAALMAGPTFSFTEPAMIMV